MSYDRLMKKYVQLKKLKDRGGHGWNLNCFAY